LHSNNGWILLGPKSRIFLAVENIAPMFSIQATSHLPDIRNLIAHVLTISEIRRLIYMNGSSGFV